ncbi:AAA family ATPase, partial [Brachybacterium alimentarium]
MCGLSFSGKSTLAARLAEGLPASVISLDLINE